MINVGRPVGSKASAGVKDNTTTEGIVGVAGGEMDSCSATFMKTVIVVV